IAKGKHPVPSRTRKLSPSAPMVLQPRGCGRVGRRRTYLCVGATFRWPLRCISDPDVRERGLTVAEERRSGRPDKGSGAGRGGSNRGKPAGQGKGGSAGSGRPGGERAGGPAGERSGRPGGERSGGPGG